MSGRAYVGTELDVFAQAIHWKSYFRSHLAPYLRGDVLEVGAGIGATTRVLCDGSQRTWACLEPDARLSAQLARSADSTPFPLTPEIITGSIEDLDPHRSFDTILYIDVLEHIEDDEAELRTAVEHLHSGGTLAVLSPAHQWLYTEFDRAIGHHRRYDRRALHAIALPGTRIESIAYLDSAGAILSMANRLLLRSGAPTHEQIRLWDRVFVRCSRLIDPLLRGRFGKSILAVWRKTDSERGR
jgi:2-polyprenyl-3-methyl-5-hydroxy-6-metoxy-1,4-benzoquinol methylase